MSNGRYKFQSPRGDFGFLKSIEEAIEEAIALDNTFQSPRGDFGFLKRNLRTGTRMALAAFQSPRGDFGFLKGEYRAKLREGVHLWFQSPRGDFGFLKVV